MKTCAASQAVTLFNNGPAVNGSGLSVLTLPASTFGFGAQAGSGNAVADNFVVNPIPEPATSALMLLGTLALVGGARRRLQQH